MASAVSGMFSWQAMSRLDQATHSFGHLAMTIAKNMRESLLPASLPHTVS